MSDPTLTFCEQCGGVTGFSYPVCTPATVSGDGNVSIIAFPGIPATYNLCLGGHAQVKPTIELDHPLSISDDKFSPLDVGLMSFQYMPGKRAVSLLAPENMHHQQIRLVNMSPQTALNLLTWLENAKETLEELAKRESVRREEQANV